MNAVTVSYVPESTAARIRSRPARSSRKTFICATAFALSSPRTDMTALRTAGTYLSVLRRAATNSACISADWRPLPSQIRVNARSTGSVCSSALTLGAIVVMTVL